MGEATPQIDQLVKLIGGCLPIGAGAPPARARSRLAQLARLTASGRDLLRSIGGAGDRILIHGDGVRLGSGEICITCDDILASGLRSILGNRPVIVLRRPREAARNDANDEGPLHDLCARLGLSPRARLTAILRATGCIIVFGDHAGRPVVVHVATDDSGAVRLERHFQTLDRLGDEDSAFVLAHLVPRPVSFSRSEAGTMLVQTRLPGTGVELGGLGEDKLLQRLVVALEPLLSVHRSGRPIPGGPDAALVDHLVTRLPETIPGLGDKLAPALQVLARWDGLARLPAVELHGDYWLGNILFEDGPLRVSGIFDWDRSRADGAALYDALHLVVATTAYSRGVHFGKILPEIWDGTRRTPVVDTYLNRLVRDSGMDRSDVEHVAILLWLSYLWNVESEGLAMDTSWFRAMIEGPSAAVGDWIRRRDRTTIAA